MKTKVLKIVFSLIVIVGIMLIIGKMQHSNVPAKCIDITGEEVTFETESGNQYIWIADEKETYVEGQNYVLYMFDFEDFDVTNDVIDKVKGGKND